jgi:hypothetical protein
MDPAEVEAILGGSRSSSEDDMRDAHRRGVGEIEAAFVTGFSRFGEGAEWRRWDGKDLQVWVVFAQTKEGKRATFSTALQKTGNTSKAHPGFFTFGGDMGHDLDQMNAQRKKEDAVRKDPKWVRGAQAQTLVAGEWRKDNIDGMTFGNDGILMEDNSLAMMYRDKKITYRIVDDKKLEITYPSVFNPPPPVPGQPPSPFKFEPVTRTFEYFVTQDELVLIEVTPNAHLADVKYHTYYRMPPTPGGAGDIKVIQPLLADLKGNDAAKRQGAIFNLRRLGKGASIALPALTELAANRDDKIAHPAIDAIADLREIGVPAVPALAAQLKNATVNRGRAIMHALGRMGPLAKDALPALRELKMKTTNQQLRQEAEVAIIQIDGKLPF